MPFKQLNNLLSFTRMRGGDPKSELDRIDKDKFYPHARG